MTAYRDSQGRRWHGRRADGWPNDQKAPDGFTVNGFRRVSQRGTFRFAGTTWVSDFAPRGVVYIWLNDALGAEVCAVEIDTSRWNPDTLNDDWRGFVQHAHACDDRERIKIINIEEKPCP